MNADLILDAFEKIDDKYIIEAKEENGNLLNECGELEAAAYRYFVEE